MVTPRTSLSSPAAHTLPSPQSTPTGCNHICLPAVIIPTAEAVACRKTAAAYSQQPTVYKWRLQVDQLSIMQVTSLMPSVCVSILVKHPSAFVYLSLSLGTLIGLISTVLQALCILVDGVLGRVSSLPSPVLCLQQK